MNIISSLTVLFFVEIIALFNTHSHIHNFLVLVAGTTLLHLIVLTQIYFISKATFIELQSTISKVILIPVVWGKSYSLLLFSLFVLMIISKHYSAYTLFTAFLSKTVFLPYKFLIKSESSQKYTKEETNNVVSHYHIHKGKK